MDCASLVYPAEHCFAFALRMDEPTPLVEVGRYPRLSHARDAALALAAKDLAYTIERVGPDWAVCVDAPLAEIARGELESFAAEEQARPSARVEPVTRKVGAGPLFVAGWILSGFFFAQQMLGEWWVEAGAATSDGIVARGEWWRLVTALTLHADMAHLVANLCTGLLFAAFVQPLFGSGWTWLLVVISGALGNAINAWGYRGEAHASIGASTAVFGALGLLVGAEFWARWTHAHARSRWTLVLPIGAGLALLAFLGVGEEHRRVDFMAHWWGFVVGIVLGLVASATQVVLGPAWLQKILGAAALLLPLAMWWWALTAVR